jgi:NADH:ubiquinone oxidoreductase subunit F (NADH-binding)
MGLLGDNILESGYNLQISLRKGPGAFVCGEETALIASLEGRRGMPSSKPPYPSSSGYLGRPTVVNNVETLSNLPAIVRKGPEWFRSIGSPDCPGTKIFSVSGRVAMAGLVEVPMGTSFDVIVNEILGGVGKQRELKALHVGGPSGCMVPKHLMDIPVTFESLKEKELVMGSGGILVMDDKTCVVNTVRYFMEYVDKQSCGKCIPCREGTRRMAEILGSITRKPEDEEGRTTLERFKGVMQLENLAEVMKDTSLCGLGQNAPNPVMSTLKYFRSEYEEHIFDRKCVSNSCTELRSWFIDVDMCTGCSICAKRCPSEAIIGTTRHPYFIVQEKCIGCGICYEVCKFSAVYYK